jgi:hypothetical protein
MNVTRAFARPTVPVPILRVVLGKAARKVVVDHLLHALLGEQRKHVAEVKWLNLVAGQLLVR